MAAPNPHHKEFTIMVPTHASGWSVRRRIADTVLPLRVLPGRHLYLFWLDS